MPDNLPISIIDITDPAEIADLEKALYRAFSSTYIKTLDQIWTIDHNGKRIVTKVGYDGQLVFVTKVSERIVAGIAVNLEIRKTLQLEMLDFAIDKSTDDFCESLYLFSLLDFVNGKTVLLSLSRILLENLRARGIKTIYGTCSERRLRPYQMMGFDKIDEHEFKGEKKYLLKMRLPEASKPVF